MKRNRSLPTSLISNRIKESTMNIIILIATGHLALQSVVFAFQQHRINLPVPVCTIQSSLRLSTDDDVQKLLEKARKLREEAATMSGKTLQEVEDEAKQQKLAQERIVEKARKERGRVDLILQIVRTKFQKMGEGGSVEPPFRPFLWNRKYDVIT